MPSYPTRKWKKPYAGRSDSRVAYGRGQAAQYTPPPAAPEPKAKAPLKIDGDGKLWVTLQKVTDPDSGWIKTTRGAQIPGGILINTCSRKLGSAIVAEALCFVPHVSLQRDEATNGWRIA